MRTEKAEVEGDVNVDAGEFEATTDDQQKTTPNEIDVYQRYSYALRDDEGFYELNRTEPVHFYQHTMPVNVYDQHTEPVPVSQHTETVPASESEKENKDNKRKKKTAEILEHASYKFEVLYSSQQAM
ncbi:hypothetical protein L1987_17765 [Smallanthus sonchifolius]|uniref:Uncharacterized protein n=1 Tax=Smallanthus sonchifolius TaxID=185202 RepID=A0ACB9IYW2_9ASTR|nr:hypothetical protein L1987_17765 [Smallanthus sonchifolius]